MVSDQKLSISSLLKPAAKVALKHGLKLQDLIEEMKSILIAVAAEQLEHEGQDPSKSKIAIMTGLQRRDVTRLSEKGGDSVRPANIITKLIGQWRADKRYCDAGNPRMLTFEGVNSEFGKLVQSVSKDVSPYAILFELERIGAAKREGDKLSLVAKTYEERTESDLAWELWSVDGEDLITAVEENLASSKGVPNLHISTRYDNIVRDALPTIKTWLLQKGAEFHAQIRAYLSDLDKDLNPTLFDREGGGKVILGSFSRVVGPPGGDRIGKDNGDSEKC